MGKELLCLDLGEGLRVLQALARLDADDGNFGVGRVNAQDRAHPDSRAFVAGVIENPLRSGLHLAQVLDRGGIRDAVPHGLAVAQQVVEGVDTGLGFEEEVGHGRCQVSGVRDQPVTRRFSLYATTS